MPNKPKFLDAPLNDPLHNRLGMSAVQYASPIQRTKRAARRIPDRVLDIAAALIVGATLGILLAWRG